MTNYRDRDSIGNNNKHNMYWIETNKRTAELFAEENDPFRMPEVQKRYDPVRDTVLKIKAFDTRIEFALLWAKGSSKHTEAYPIGYHMPPDEFYNKMVNAYNFYKKKLDAI